MKLDTGIQFRRVENKKQFLFNQEIMERLQEISRSIERDYSTHTSVLSPTFLVSYDVATNSSD